MLYTSTIHWHTRVTVNSSVLLVFLFAKTQTCVFAIAVKCMVAVRKSLFWIFINSFQSLRHQLERPFRKKTTIRKTLPFNIESVVYVRSTKSSSVCLQESNATESIHALGRTLLNQTSDLQMHVCRCAKTCGCVKRCVLWIMYSRAKITART